MRRYFLLGVFLFVMLLSLSPRFTPVSSADANFVTCDACGYCPVIVNGPNSACSFDPVAGPVPGNWATCVKCLYPSLYPTGAVPDPGLCDTVRIIPTTLLPPTPYVGRQYTMIGCLTSAGGFQNNTNTGASSFVQALFDLLVFRITGGIAFLYLMYGAFLVLTSQAEPERLNQGKRVIFGAVIGLIFTLGSVFIVNLIGSGILRMPGFSGQTITP